MTSVINFPFDGRDIIFEFAGLDISSIARDGSVFDPSMILKGQGFFLSFDPDSTTIKEINSQGELVFEGITRTFSELAVTIPGVTGTRTATRGSVGFGLELDINQFTLGKKYSLGLKVEATVIPGEADVIHPPSSNAGSLASPFATLHISSGGITIRQKATVNPFQPWFSLIAAGVKIQDDDRLPSFPFNASFEMSSDFVDIRDKTGDNLMVSCSFEGKVMRLKRVILTKREST